MKHLFRNTLAALAGASFLLTACSTASSVRPVDMEENSDKNVLDVEWRILPPDYENLAAREAEKWNFNFRPYSQESASMLWSDPNTVRSIMQGSSDGKNFPTALYASADQRGLSILIFGAMKEGAINNGLKAGNPVPEMEMECSIIPGDADNPKIINWQPFGPTSKPSISWGLSWMKWDRDNRDLLGAMELDARRVPSGVVVKIAVPWVALYDQVPFIDGKKDEFWRLSLIRWDMGGVTWGGVVHQQLQPGYLRFNLTQAQKTAIMKHVLIECWKRYLEVRNSIPVNPAKTYGRSDANRIRTIESVPHSYMNVNEDWGFRDAWLMNAIKERNELGKQIADFEKLSPEDQLAFYKKTTRILYNFQIDIDDALGKYHKDLLMNLK